VVALLRLILRAYRLLRFGWGDRVRVLLLAVGVARETRRRTRVVAVAGVRYPCDRVGHVLALPSPACVWCGVDVETGEGPAEVYMP
jgi:hypothetical protein